MCNLYKSKIWADFLDGRNTLKVVEYTETVESIKLEFIESQLVEYFNHV